VALPDAKTQPGRNGGTLKKGNTKNVGAIRKDVKLAHVQNAKFSMSKLTAIVKMHSCIPVPGKKDKRGRQMFRTPTMDEWKWAVEMSNRYGTGTNLEVAGDEDAAIKVVYKFE
jgi:hypothetical protein